jgi:hypothetical protein
MNDADGYPYRVKPSGSIIGMWLVTAQQSGRYRYVAYLGTEAECRVVGDALNKLYTEVGPEGVEPPFTGPKPVVLPLDERPARGA